MSYQIIVAQSEEFMLINTYFAEDGTVYSENMRYEATVSGDVLPDIVASYEQYEEWYSLVLKTENAFKRIFFKSIFIDSLKFYLNPIQFKRIDCGIIKYSCNNYNILVGDKAVVVNYDLGKFKEFSLVIDALDWVLNVHYPAKQQENLNSIISK